MADDSNSSGSSFGDILKAATALALVFTLQAGANALLASQNKADSQSLLVAVKQPIPACLIWVGDYARAAPVWAFHRAKDGVDYSVRLISDGRLDSIARIYLGDDWVGLDGAGYVTTVNGLGPDDIDGRYIDQRVRILTRLGRPVEDAYGEITAKLPEWTSAHRGDNTGSLALICSAPEAKFFSQAFPFGFPGNNLTVVARGVCYDWRDGTQARNLPETWKWSANPVVWLTHLEWYRWGLDWTRQVQPVLAALTAEADICDEPVALAAGGTEKRYRVAGVYKDDEDWNSVRQKIMATMDGQRSLDGLGRLVITAGKYRAPDVTLTASDITASTWQGKVVTERKVDRLQVFFTSPDDNYAKGQCDDWVINEDGSAVEDFYVDWCYSWTQARRLAYRKALERMPPSQGSLSTNIGGLKTWAQRFVRVTYDLDSDLGIDDIVIQVPAGIEPQKLAGFNLSGFQTGPHLDTWVPELHEGNPPSSETKVTPGKLDKPLITGLEAFFDSLGGLTGVRLRVTGYGPARDDLTYRLRWKQDGAPQWSPPAEVTATVLGGGFVTFDSDFVVSAPLVDVEITYTTGGGTQVGWSDTMTVNTYVAGGSTFESLVTETGDLIVTETGESLVV